MAQVPYSSIARDHSLDLEAAFDTAMENRDRFAVEVFSHQPYIPESEVEAFVQAVKQRQG